MMELVPLVKCTGRDRLLERPSRHGVVTCGLELLLGAAWCRFASPVLAQRAAPARIDGVITDSVHATPLANALVLLARPTSDTAISVSTTTDAKGRFVFADLPAGAYVVALESALLDSLELYA